MGLQLPPNDDIHERHRKLIIRFPKGLNHKKQKAHLDHKVHQGNIDKPKTDLLFDHLDRQSVVPFRDSKCAIEKIHLRHDGEVLHLFVILIFCEEMILGVGSAV